MSISCFIKCDLSHKKIANAIKERDEELAEQLMKEHIEMNQKYLDESFL